MTAPTPAQFRIDFPEFADSAKYPDLLCNLWLQAAASMVNLARWGALAALGQELCAAHFIALAARDRAIGPKSKGIPGQVSGPVASKTVGSVSASYAPQIGTIQDAGQWNSTAYGVRFIGLARLMGAGGMQFPS